MKRGDIIHAVETTGMDFFTIRDLEKLFPGEKHIKISVKRLLDAGVIIRVTRGIYALKPENLDIEKIATRLYYPSYISFESALAKFGVINQGLYGLTLATTRHSKKMTLAGLECDFAQLKDALFTGFDLVNGTYIAQPEKALLDLLYLICLGRRRVNPAEWVLDGLNKEKITEYLRLYPSTVGKKVEDLGIIFR
jgi:predicted transcriptional regulator of viral defense system